MRKFRSILFVVCVVGLTVSLISTLFFSIKIRERDRYLDKLIETTLSGDEAKNNEEIAVKLSKAIHQATRKPLSPKDLDRYSRWESTSPFNVTSAVSLRYGGFGVEGHSTYGACGTMSRTLLNALWKLNIPARKLQLLDNEEGRGGGHTMIEFRSGDRWLVISPSDNSFVWRTNDGRIATAKEIHDDDELFAQIYQQDPGYPYLFDNYRNIRWDKLPRPVAGLFRVIMGETRYNSAVTPGLYDKPRTLFVIVSLILCGLFACGAALTFSKPRNTSGRGAAH